LTLLLAFRDVMGRKLAVTTNTVEITSVPRGCGISAAVRSVRLHRGEGPAAIVNY
jgi:hypothetical protein